MVTVHHLNNSRSQRVLWLLEELGVDYEITRYERDPHTMLAPKSLREVHPLGKSPVITDGPHVIAESGAILEHLVDTYGQGRLRPEPDSDAYLRYRYWMHYAEGSAMPSLLLKIVFDQLPKQGPLLARPLLKGVSLAVSKQFIDPEVNKHMRYWEQELNARPHFAGEAFTAADIQMSFPVEGAMSRGADVTRYPRLTAWLDAVRQRPAFQRALSRGGEFSLKM